MTRLFEEDRTYVLGDEELELIGDRDKLAQWRHKGVGPAYYRLGRKIVYRGADLNAWAEANRVDPQAPEIVEDHVPADDAAFADAAPNRARRSRRPAGGAMTGGAR